MFLYKFITHFRIQTNKEGLFDYENIMDFLNYQLKPAQMIIPHPAKTTKYIQRFSVRMPKYIYYS